MSHICSNRNGLDDFRSNGFVSSKIRQWSDLTLGRWWIWVDGKSISHSALPKPLSKRSLMVVCQTGLLLVQVKRGPWNPRSMRPQVSMQFLKAAIRDLFTGRPPSFSSSEVISLKSPIRTHGRAMFITTLNTIVTAVFFLLSLSSFPLLSLSPKSPSCWDRCSGLVLWVKQLIHSYQFRFLFPAMTGTRTLWSNLLLLYWRFYDLGFLIVHF